MKHLPYDRAERVGQAIFELMAELFREKLTDPRLDGIQITGAKITKDLRLARVYYFLGANADSRKLCSAGLKSAAGYLKCAVAERLAMKFTPEIEFHFDDSIERGERVDELLNKLTHQG